MMESGSGEPDRIAAPLRMLHQVKPVFAWLLSVWVYWAFVAAIAALVAIAAMLHQWFDWSLESLGDWATVIAATAAVVYVTLTHAMVLELREGRLTQNRPFVYVDFTVGPESDGLIMNVRNQGAGPATDIHMTFSSRLLDRDEKDILQNPVLRDGISFLAPRQVLSIPLHRDTQLMEYIEAQPWVPVGSPKPLPQIPRVTCGASYRDAITHRRYTETFRVDLAPEASGWQRSTM